MTTKKTLSERIAESIVDAFCVLGTAIAYVVNKAVAIGLLLFLAHSYKAFVERATATGEGAAYVELFYAAVVVMTVAVGAPLFRLLVFPEAATYAESGKMCRDLYGTNRRDALTPGVLHYWFATATSYAVVTILLLASMWLG